MVIRLERRDNKEIIKKLSGWAFIINWLSRGQGEGGVRI